MEEILWLWEPVQERQQMTNVMRESDGRYLWFFREFAIIKATKRVYAGRRILMWLFMILLWLIAPALELVIIVALGIANDRKTREIRRLQTELKKYGWQEGMQKQWEQNTLPMKKGKAGVPEEGKSFRPVQPEMQSMSEERKIYNRRNPQGKNRVEWQCWPCWREWCLWCWQD